MFQKRIIELFTFVVYWLVLVPYAHEYAKQQKWLTLDLNNFSDVVSKYAIFLVAMIVAYMIMYRIILWSYMKCKVCDIEMFNNLKQMRLDPESGLSQDDLSRSKSVNALDQIYTAVSTVDEVDAPRRKLTMKRAKSHEILTSRRNLQYIGSPSLQHQHRLLSRTNSGYESDTLSGVHGASPIRPLNTKITEYCIRKPAPPPPPATPKFQRRPGISMDPRPDLIEGTSSVRSTPATPVYGMRKQFVLPPIQSK